MKLRPFLGVLAVSALSSAHALAGDGVVKTAPAKEEPTKAEEGAAEGDGSAGKVSATDKADGEKKDEKAEGKKTDRKKSDEDGEKKDGEEGDGEKDSGQHIVRFGVGGLFMGGAVGLLKPDDQSFPDMAGPEDYPGFAGMSLGGGGFVDVRFIDYVGIEFGVLHMTDRGSAEIKISDSVGNTVSKFDVKLKQNALHMPIYLKGAIPGPMVNITGFVGPEIVLPLVGCKDDAADRFDKPECKAEVIPDPQFPNSTGNYGIVTKTSVLVSGGVGFEFKLPIPSVDIRIPFSLRFAGDPSASDKRTDRELHTNGRVEYRTNWQLQGHAALGAAIYF